MSSARAITDIGGLPELVHDGVNGYLLPPGDAAAIFEEIRRGDVLAHPGQYQATRRLDARFKALKDIRKPLAHGDEVKFFVGASETIAALT